ATAPSAAPATAPSNARESERATEGSLLQIWSPWAGRAGPPRAGAAGPAPPGPDRATRRDDAHPATAGAATRTVRRRLWMTGDPRHRRAGPQPPEAGDGVGVAVGR